MQTIDTIGIFETLRKSLTFDEKKADKANDQQQCAHKWQWLRLVDIFAIELNQNICDNIRFCYIQVTVAIGFIASKSTAQH